MLGPPQGANRFAGANELGLLKVSGCDADLAVMMDHGDPPPPSASNPAPSASAERLLVASSEDDLRGVTVVAAMVGAALVGFRVLGAILTGQSAAHTLGAAVGTLVLPVVLAALIGWGNDRRARIAFIVIAGLVLLSTMARAGASLSETSGATTQAVALDAGVD